MTAAALILPEISRRGEPPKVVEGSQCIEPKSPCTAFHAVPLPCRRRGGCS